MDGLSLIVERQIASLSMDQRLIQGHVHLGDGIRPQFIFSGLSVAGLDGEFETDIFATGCRRDHVIITQGGCAGICRKLDGGLRSGSLALRADRDGNILTRVVRVIGIGIETGSLCACDRCFSLRRGQFSQLGREGHGVGELDHVAGDIGLGRERPLDAVIAQLRYRVFQQRFFLFAREEQSCRS